MYILTKCQEQEDNFYNAKKDLKTKDIIINNYFLESKGSYKEYWENNVNIIFSKIENTFEYVIDKDVYYDKQFDGIIQEVEVKQCIPYNFYNVDSEEVYILYENTINDIKIQMKVYEDYYLLIFYSDSLDNLKNIDNFNI